MSYGSFIARRGRVGMRRRRIGIRRPIRRVVRRRRIMPRKAPVPRPRMMKRPRVGGSFVRRKRQRTYHGQMNEFSKVKNYIRGRRYSLSKLVKANLNHTILRFQNLTNFDVDGGAIPLRNVLTTGDSKIEIPLNVFDLTIIPNRSANVQAGRRYVYDSSLANAAVGTATVVGTDPTGSTSPYWIVESGAPSVPYNTDSIYHDWTQVKLNLYGARKRTTYFDVYFVRFKDDFANLFAASLSNNEVKQLVAYLVRPLMYSNILLHNPDVVKKLAIVKKYRYMIGPQQTIDLNSTCGKMKEVNIFMRHNTRYNLRWKSDEYVPSAAGADRLDWEINSDVDNQDHPVNRGRLFMMITAFAPEQRTVGGNVLTPALEPIVDPSYDVLIRNAFTHLRNS